MESETTPIAKEELQPISFIPIKRKKPDYSQFLPINFTNSNFISKFFYFWVKPAIDLSNKRPLNIEDVGKISKEQRTCENMELYQEIFNKKVSSKKYKYPLFFSIFSLHLKYFLFIYFLFIIDFSFVYSKIYFFKKIISTFSTGDFFPEREFSIFNISNFRLNIIESIILYIIARMMGSYNYHYLLLQNEILNRKIINETSALLMDKLLRSNAINSSFSKGEGEKINLVEIDAEKIGYFFLWFPRISIYPFKISFSMYLLFKIYGAIYIFAILGLVLVVIVIISFQIVYNRNIKYVLYQKDQRMKIVTYVFTVLKNLKLDDLEEEFIKRIDNKRKEEIDITRKQFNLEIIIGVLNKNLNLILMILTLYIFVNSKDQQEISSLFASFQLINTITGPITVIPIFLSRIAGNLISIKRLQAFLLSEDHYDYPNDNRKDDIAIKFSNTSFGIKSVKLMDKNEKVNMDFNNKDITDEINIFEKLNLEIKKGEFVAVVGDSGSGKTSLLHAIMNNFSIISTDSNPRVCGEISFLPSQPWLMTESIKNNIIFFNELKEKIYKEIISLCYLKSDFEKLSEGDLTIVNSTCSNISEGQKIRISLARCLYRNADIYLLDDLFSALDYNISQKIFEGVFCNYLKDKTRIMVINKKEFLKYFNKIIVLENRKVKFFGKYEQFKQFEQKENLELNNNKKRTYEDNNNINKNTKKKKNKHTNSINENKNNINKNEDNANIEKNDDVILSEYINPNDALNSISRNHVSYKTYLNYIKLQGGYTLFFTLIILIIIVKSFEIYRNTIIPKLAKSYKEISKEEKSKINNDLFISDLKLNFYIFLRVSLVTVFLDFVVRFVTTRITLNSMHVVHHKMAVKLIKAPINLFHDLVPVGQILNRLTRDVGVIESIIRVVNSFIRRIFSLVSCMILCYLYNKLIIFLSPIIVIYALLLTTYYIKTTRNLTRIQRISYAPIMTVFSETIRGLDIIRTCHVELNTRNKFLEKIDERYGIHLFSAGLRRWHTIRRSTFINLTFGVIILYMAYYPETFSVRAIAIILQYTDEFLNHLINTSVFYMDLETNMIGLERCEQIFKIETEKNSEDFIYDEIKYENWPEKGSIEFINYFARYRPNTPDILKNINLKIKKGEKVCFVGRTGSGKSSLINALVRIIEPRKGKIYIDNDDIQNININILRKKIAILPQEIFLIESNLRDNIDPLNMYNDKDILNLINDLALFKNISEKNKLNFEIKENGKNLSSGEKKLICFARTIIRQTKIVILDDPTGGLDAQTKNIIFKNVKKYLKDKTVIIITNQEDWIKSCDKIAVVDNGNIVETGSYEKLIKDKNNFFNNLFINNI